MTSALIRRGNLDTDRHAEGRPREDTGKDGHLQVKESLGAPEAR